MDNGRHPFRLMSGIYAALDQCIDHILFQNKSDLRNLLFFVAATQLTFAFTASSTALILHADGAYFTYLIASGSSWALKWRDASSRATTYVFTIWPTEMVADVFSLSPMQIAHFYGAAFYAIHLFQLLIAVRYANRLDKRLTIFPISQYALTTSFGFGFPSEILIAPGFCWIACFSMAKKSHPGIVFFPAWIALIFSHEMALPTAILISFFTIRQALQRSDYGFALLMGIFFSGALLAYYLVRETIGGSGLNWAAVYALDPRRIFSSIGLVMASIFLVIFLLIFRRRSTLLSRYSVTSVIIAMAAIGPMLLSFIWPDANFERGRYEAARTAVSAGMFVLTALYFLALPRLSSRPDCPDQGAHRLVPVAITIGLAISISSSALFVRDWTIALSALKRVVSTAEDQTPPKLMGVVAAQQLMSAREAESLTRINYEWALLFRSAVLADGSVPKVLVYGQDALFFGCDRRPPSDLTGYAIPPLVLITIRDFVCSRQTSPPSLREIILRRIRSWSATAPEARLE